MSVIFWKVCFCGMVSVPINRVMCFDEWCLITSTNPLLNEHRFLQDLTNLQGFQVTRSGEKVAVGIVCDRHKRGINHKQCKQDKCVQSE